MDKPQLVIKNNKADGYAETAIRGDIGHYSGEYIAEQIINDEGKKMRLRMNSFGGHVLSGMSIITAMVLYQENGGVIETVNEGCADSTAGWIFACGTKGKRRIMQFGSMLLHPPMYEDGTTINDLPEGDPRRQVLEDNFDKLINIFIPVTGRSYKDIRNLMLNNTEMDADMAIREGFADQKVLVNNMPILKNGLTRAEIVNVTSGIEFQEVNTPDSGQINKYKMNKVALLVNLNPEASQEAIETAVKAIINRAETAEGALVKEREKVTNLTAEVDGYKATIQEQKDASIVAYVDEVIANDAAKKPQREAMLNMAKGNFEAFKVMVPLTAKTEKEGIIDQNIDEQENAGTQKEAEIASAKEFMALTNEKRNELKNSNYAKFLNDSAMYEKHFSEIS